MGLLWGRLSGCGEAGPVVMGRGPSIAPRRCRFYLLLSTYPQVMTNWYTQYDTRFPCLSRLDLPPMLNHKAGPLILLDNGEAPRARRNVIDDGRGTKFLNCGTATCCDTSLFLTIPRMDSVVWFRRSSKWSSEGITIRGQSSCIFLGKPTPSQPVYRFRMSLSQPTLQSRCSAWFSHLPKLKHGWSVELNDQAGISNQVRMSSMTHH